MWFNEKLYKQEEIEILMIDLLHFVAFFHVASLFSTGVDNEKVGVDYEKALELDNITPKLNATKHPVA